MAAVEAIDAGPQPAGVKFVSQEMVKSDRPELAAVTVLANLVWYDDTLAWLGPTLLILALLLAVVGVRAGGQLLTRTRRV